MAKYKTGWTIYKSRSLYNPGWRWRFVARNGNIIAASSESYTRRANCVRNARKFGYGEVTNGG